MAIAWDPAVVLVFTSSQLARLSTKTEGAGGRYWQLSPAVEGASCAIAIRAGAKNHSKGAFYGEIALI